MSWVVVKLGGELIPGKLAGVAEGVKAFLTAGKKLAIVHGGGPQATELTKKLGLQPVQIAGRRVTDDAVLTVMKQALAGQVSVDLAAAFRALHVPVVALHGVSAGLIEAEKRPPRVITGGPPEPVDLGHVGDVTSVNVPLLEAIAAAGYVPALASIGGDARGHVFNINADVVAGQVAAALKAERLLLVSGVPGVLRDPADPSTRFPRLTRREAHELIAQGVIAGGMIPKVEEALGGLTAGVGAVHICGAAEGSLAAEAREPGSSGTVLLP